MLEIEIPTIFSSGSPSFSFCFLIIISIGILASGAKTEATRDGAPLIDLIDGDAFCDLLKDNRLGVKTEMVEKISVDTDWFEKNF